MRNNLVSERLRQQIDAVEAALQNDTSEARSMLVRLEKNVGPDELSIVRSEIAHLENAIVNRELDSIEARTREAQSYLTRYSVTYAEDLRHGKRPKVELTSGLVNLVRARSIQAGIVRQLEMLADTPMSDVSRARLTGSLETERTALRLMDESLFQRQVMIWTFAGLLVALATFGLICVKNQRSHSWFEKKWRLVMRLSAPGQNLPTTPAA